MAVLKSIQNSVEHPVAARLLVGRSPACTLRLDNRHVSGEHATLTWTGGHWELRDLGSRNGTYVNGHRLEAGRRAPLARGARIAFGDPDDGWELSDAGPPTPMAVHVATRKIQVGQGDFLVLPNADHPEVSLFGDETGWWVDSGDGRPTAFESETLLCTSHGDWHVMLPSICEGTPVMQLHLEAVQLDFAVSRDEERVEIRVVTSNVSVQIPSREHNYVLLTLARARIDDASLPMGQRGWRERGDLERMLALDENALNVAIHRARQQLSAAGVQGAARVVEVRRKQRRLGTDRFRIRTLDTHE